MRSILNRERERRGLSLAEMLVAIFVVSVGVLGTTSALWYGIKSERYAQRRTAAVFQAQELLNQIKASQFAFNPEYAVIGSDLNDGDYDDDGDDDGPRKEFNATPFGNYFPDNPHNFQRRVEMKTLSTDMNSHLSRIAAIKVTLFWNEGASEKKVTLWALQRQP